MKILIAACSFASNISGVQRHAFNVARCLLLQQEISALHLVVAPWQQHLAAQAGLPNDPRLIVHVGNMSLSSFSRNYWYYRDLPKIATRLNVDVVHFSYPMPLNAAAFSCPTVVTLHDLYPYEIPMNFGFPKFIFNRIVLQQCLRNADAIACVSESTCSRLRSYAPPHVWRKSIRVYNCVEAEPVTSTETPAPGCSGEPFLLCIAQHRRNKNIPLLIGAFDQLLWTGQIAGNTKLVVVGISGPESRFIEGLISARGLRSAVYLLEGLSGSQLQWCYLNCDALVAPSVVEGFGLPIAEGLLVGCRIVCSDIPAHREIGDGLCQFVALRNDGATALANTIALALHKPKPAPVELPQFSRPVLAREYLALYRRMIASVRRVQTGTATSSSGNAASESTSVGTPDRTLALQYKGK